MKKNKNILLLTITLLTLVLLTIPLIGTVEANRYSRRCRFRRITKIEGVKLTDERTQVSGDPQFFGDTVLNRGTSTGTVWLDIPGQDLLEGTWNGQWVSMVTNHPDYPGVNPEAELRVLGTQVLTFTGVGTTGTFNGVVDTKMIGYPPPFSTYLHVQMVLQGTGDFKGQTLKLSYEGAPPSTGLEGYLIIRK